MSTSISRITREQRDALRIVEAFTSAIAFPALYPEAALMAAHHIESNEYADSDDCREILTAFAKFLREQANTETFIVEAS